MVGWRIVVVAAGLVGCSNEVSQLRWEVDEDLGSLVHVRWRQGVRSDVWVEYSVDPGVWRSTPVLEGRAGRNDARIIGIPYGERAEWRVVTASGATAEGRTIETAPVPAELPVGRLREAVPGKWLDRGEFLLTSISQPGGGWSSSGPFWAVIVDRAGRPVWARRTQLSGQWTLYAQVSQSGDHLLLDQFENFRAQNEPVAIRTYLDEVIEEIPMPGHHHAFVELPDGSLVWGSRAARHGGGEALVKKSPGEKGETVLWTCADDWPEGHELGCRSNCVYYDEARDSFLYSFYTNESVVEVDHQTGTTLWWAGRTPGGYAFENAGDQFFWQHGVSWTPEGTLLVSTHDADAQPNTNLAREFEVDHDARLLRTVWDYDANGLAATNGDAWRLDNGNTLHTLGSASFVKEVDPDGEVVWHLDFNENNNNRLMGRSEWISDLYSLLSP